MFLYLNFLNFVEEYIGVCTAQSIVFKHENSMKTGVILNNLYYISYLIPP